MKVPEFFYPGAVAQHLIDPNSSEPLLPRARYSLSRGLTGSYRANRDTFFDKHPHHLHVADHLHFDVSGMCHMVELDYLNAERLTIAGRRTKYDLPVQAQLIKAGMINISDAVVETAVLKATTLIINTASRLVVGENLEVGEILFVHDTNRGGLRVHRANRWKNTPVQLGEDCRFVISGAKVTSSTDGYKHHPLISVGGKLGVSGGYGCENGPYQSENAFIYHCGGVMDGTCLTCVLTVDGPVFSVGAGFGMHTWEAEELVGRLKRDICRIISMVPSRHHTWTARLTEHRTAVSFIQNMMMACLPYQSLSDNNAKHTRSVLDTCRDILDLCETAVLTNLNRR